ncbi:hypothetical protein HDU76_006301, partial [Blyttiomyces sp. JEL0837]
MENWLIPELIDLVYENTDILTSYLNNRLSEEEVKAKGNDIWSEAFHQDWQGDLNLLPQDGFPTAFTGLCNVKTRSMYERLCQHRPDLAGIPDSLRVYLRANKRYGYFSESDHRPIVLLDDDDEIEHRHDTSLSYYKQPVYQNVLSIPLIQIAMRQCWIEDLQPLIKLNPHRLFLLAINMRHEELAIKMIQDWGLVVLEQIPRTLSEFMDGMEEIGRSGSLRFLKFIITQKNTSQNYQNRQCLLFRYIMNGAMEAGRLSVLQYIEREFRETQPFSDAFTQANGDSYIYSCFRTESLDCWEWSVNICIKLGVKCDTLLTVKNVNEARRVVEKLGNQPLTNLFLGHAARNSNPETFKYLWSHRNPLEFLILYLRDETNSDTAKFKFLNLSPSDILPLEAVQFYLSHEPSLDKVIEVFYSAAENGRLDVVEYLFSAEHVVLEDRWFIWAINEKNLNVIKLFGDSKGTANMNTAAKCGNLEAVKFFHQHCCDQTTGNNTILDGAKTCSNIVCRRLARQAFCSAALKGDFDTVRFLVENRREDCNLEKGMLTAIVIGSFRLVRYFYALGLTEFKDEGVLAKVKKWLGLKSGKGDMA